MPPTSSSDIENSSTSSDQESLPTICKPKRVKLLSTKRYMVRRQFRSTKRIAVKGRRKTEMEDEVDNISEESSEEESSPTKCKCRRVRVLSTKKYRTGSQFRSAMRITAKEKRTRELEEVMNRISRIKLQKDFTISIIQAFRNTSPHLQIGREVVSFLNAHLNHAFSHMAKASAIFALVRNTVPDTTDDIDLAISTILTGDLNAGGIFIEH